MVGLTTVCEFVPAGSVAESTLAIPEGTPPGARVLGCPISGKPDQSKLDDRGDFAPVVRIVELLESISGVVTSGASFASCPRAGMLATSKRPSDIALLP